MNSTHTAEFDRQLLQQLQTEKLRALLQAVVPANAFWTTKFKSAGVDINDVHTLTDLQRLPFCTKAELVADHAAHPPYSSNLTYPVTEYSRLHQTSGTTGRPLRWLDTPASWKWFMDCWADIFRLVEIQPTDRFAFPFSFGPFIGFWAAFEGAARLGYLTLPGGGMTTQARLQLIADNHATIVCCTPTYALRMIEVAAAENIDLPDSSVRALIVAGEPGGSIPATRERLANGFGARVFDHWGMTEIGALGIEPANRPNGLTILESHCIPEILDPATQQPVTPGEQGELVITNLGRTGSPLIRYRTGDLVQAATTPDPDGRCWLHLEGGILGRADDMVTIRGNNVFPSSLEAILREFPEIAEYRITVRTVRAMQQLSLELEPAANTRDSQQLVARVQRTIKDRLNFQPDVTLVPTNALPRFELKGRRFLRDDG